MRQRCAVLVYEDVEVERLLTANLAPELDVQRASSVQEALTLFDGLARVDLAFLELQLCDGAGDELLEPLARWPEAIRVLLGAPPMESKKPLRNRHLAHIVLSKPPPLRIVSALKAAVLGLPRA
jgi:CheY-like chemotaxis protein